MLMPFKPTLFIFGLGSFLIAHVFYITLFLKSPKSQVPPTTTIHVKILLACLIYGTVLIGFLYQQQNSAFLLMQIPVIVYACVILLMLMAAFNFYKKYSKSGIWIIVGALLFVLSDSTIALSKFSHLFENNQSSARVIIMSLYGIAQFMIVKGYLLSTISDQTYNNKVIPRNK